MHAMSESGPGGESAGTPKPAGNPSDARLRQLHRLVEAEPNDAFCLYGLGQEYAQRGATDDAIRWYDRCLAADPSYCYAHYHKAKALENAGRTEEAIASLRSGLATARSTGDAHAASEIAAFLDELGD